MLPIKPDGAENVSSVPDFSKVKFPFAVGRMDASQEHIDKEFGHAHSLVLEGFLKFSGQTIGSELPNIFFISAKPSLLYPF